VPATAGGPLEWPFGTRPRFVGAWPLGCANGRFRYTCPAREPVPRQTNRLFRAGPGAWPRDQPETADRRPPPGRGRTDPRFPATGCVIDRARWASDWKGASRSSPAGRADSVRRWATEGMQVAVADLDPPARDGVLAVAVDVADAGSAERMAVAVLERFGRIDVLVNEFL